MRFNTKTAEADAQTLGVKSWVENNRFKLSGTVANVRKVIAAQGLDFIREGQTVWAIRSGGELAGMLVRSDTEDFAYFYSSH